MGETSEGESWPGESEGGNGAIAFPEAYKTAEARTALVKSCAAEVGFNMVGVTELAATRYGEEYKAWLAAGKMGEMKYLGNQIEERIDPTKKWPWARGVVVVGMRYYQERPKGEGENKGAEGKIARYAWGRDYHRVMETKLRKFEKMLRQALGETSFQARACCDTAPIQERELAARAGLGWVGKNTLLIHPEEGSWFVLGEMITSMDLVGDQEMGSHCGTCRRCIEACPTRALEPWQMDARKCISYLTLEHRSEIPEEMRPAMAEAGYIVGCDICQEVCPFNRDALNLTEEDFKVQRPAPAVVLSEVKNWTLLDWDKATRGHAHRRAKFEMWQRNATILEGKYAGGEGCQNGSRGGE